MKVCQFVLSRGLKFESLDFLIRCGWSLFGLSKSRKPHALAVLNLPMQIVHVALVVLGRVARSVSWFDLDQLFADVGPTWVRALAVLNPRMQIVPFFVGGSRSGSVFCLLVYFWRVACKVLGG